MDKPFLARIVTELESKSLLGLSCLVLSVSATRLRQLSDALTRKGVSHTVGDAGTPAGSYVRLSSISAARHQTLQGYHAVWQLDPQAELSPDELSWLDEAIARRREELGKLGYMHRPGVGRDGAPYWQSAFAINFARRLKEGRGTFAVGPFEIGVGSTAAITRALRLVSARPDIGRITVVTRGAMRHPWLEAWRRLENVAVSTVGSVQRLTFGDTVIDFISDTLAATGRYGEKADLLLLDELNSVSRAAAIRSLIPAAWTCYVSRS